MPDGRLGTLASAARRIGLAWTSGEVLASADGAEGAEARVDRLGLYVEDSQVSLAQQETKGEEHRRAAACQLDRMGLGEAG